MNKSQERRKSFSAVARKNINDFLVQANFPGVKAESGGWCEQATTVSLTTLFFIHNEVQLLQLTKYYNRA